MTEVETVLSMIAKELADTAKSSMPELQAGQLIKREWLEDGKYFREIKNGSHTSYICYDFKQRKCFKAKKMKGCVIIEIISVSQNGYRF